MPLKKILYVWANSISNTADGLPIPDLEIFPNQNCIHFNSDAAEASIILTSKIENDTRGVASLGYKFD